MYLNNKPPFHLFLEGIKCVYVFVSACVLLYSYIRIYLYSYIPIYKMIKFLMAMSHANHDDKGSGNDDDDGGNNNNGYYMCRQYKTIETHKFNVDSLLLFGCRLSLSFCPRSLSFIHTPAHIRTPSTFFSISNDIDDKNENAT